MVNLFFLEKGIIQGEVDGNDDGLEQPLCTFVGLDGQNQPSQTKVSARR